MLFWTRALVCIGAVTVLAVQHQPRAQGDRPPLAAAHGAVDVAQGLCRSRPDLCATALAGNMTASAALASRAAKAALRRDVVPGPVAIGGLSLTSR